MSQSEQLQDAFRLAGLIGELKAVAEHVKKDNERLTAENVDLKRQLAEKVGCRCQ